MTEKNNVIAGLSEIVGNKNVISDEKSRKAFLATYQGFEKPAFPEAIVYAGTTEEIQAIVNYIREETDLGIVVCSSEGKYRLTANALPKEGTRSIILNLSRMKRIFRIDTRNRVAFVEPGVTFTELEAALKGTGLKLDYPFQARGDKSVLAALLDRTPITAPLNVWDTNDPLLCLEVVFGNGKIFRTGSAAGPGTLEEQWEAGVAMNNPMGPSHTDFARVLSGSQGTLGIVCWASIKLEFELSVEKMLYAEGGTVSELAPVAWRGIRRRLGNNYLLLNDFALGCVFGHDRKEIDMITGAAAEWTLAINMAGKRIRPEEKVKYQTEDLISLAAHTDGIRINLKEKIDAVSNIEFKNAVTGLSTGKYWKYRYEGHALDIYFLTTLDQADEYVNAVKEICGNDCKTAVYIQPCMQGRNAHLEFVIPYSDDNRTQAKSLYKKLMKALLAKGAFFSRPYGICEDQIFEKAPMQIRTIEKLKKMFDDRHILNPNRFYNEKEVAK